MVSTDRGGLAGRGYHLAAFPSNDEGKAAFVRMAGGTARIDKDAIWVVLRGDGINPERATVEFVIAGVPEGKHDELFSMLEMAGYEERNRDSRWPWNACGVYRLSEIDNPFVIKRLRERQGMWLTYDRLSAQAHNALSEEHLVEMWPELLRTELTPPASTTPIQPVAAPAQQARTLAEFLGVPEPITFEARLDMSADAALYLLPDAHQVDRQQEGPRTVVGLRYWKDDLWPYDALENEECTYCATVDVLALGPGSCRFEAVWLKGKDHPYFPVFEDGIREILAMGGSALAATPAAAPARPASGPSGSPSHQTPRERRMAEWFLDFDARGCELSLNTTASGFATWLDQRLQDGLGLYAELVEESDATLIKARDDEDITTYVFYVLTTGQSQIVLRGEFCSDDRVYFEEYRQTIEHAMGVFGGHAPSLPRWRARSLSPAATPAQPASERLSLEEPPKDANLGQWFEWQDAMALKGLKVTLKDLAHRAGRVYQHVKNEHANWRAEHPDPTARRATKT